MNRKTLGIALVSLGSLLLLFIIYLMFFYKNESEVPASTERQTEVQTQAQLPKIESQQAIPQKVENKKPLTKEELNKDELKRMAMLFAERFGSYSNQSTFQNISDLEIFMTANMKIWARNFVEEQNAKNDGAGIYYGIVTRAVTAEAKEFDTATGKAEFHVGTQRRESTGSTNNSTNFGQVLKIKFMKESGTWRVDEARWDDNKLR